MTTPQFTLNFILMLTIILGMTGCLSTEERNALELREKEALLSADRARKAKSLYSGERKLGWEKQNKIEFPGLEFYKGTTWQYKSQPQKNYRKGNGNRYYSNDTALISYCPNLNFEVNGFVASGFTLPSNEQLNIACIAGNILVDKAAYRTSKLRVKGSSSEAHSYELFDVEDRKFETGKNYHEMRVTRRCEPIPFDHKEYGRHFTSLTMTKCATDEPFVKDILEYAMLIYERESLDQSTGSSKTKSQRLDDAYIEAMDLKYGAPFIKSTNFDALTERFLIVIGSQRSKFETKYSIPLKQIYAKTLKELITKKSFQPTVNIKVTNGIMSVVNIEEIKEPELAVVMHLFNRARSNKKSLQKLLSSFKQSSLVPEIQHRINELDNLAAVKQRAKAELARDNADGKIVGTQNLEGAMYIAGRIWQDQPVNKRFRGFMFKDAKTYCERLTHLDNDNWRLPSVEDYKKLGNDFHNFKYIAHNPNYSANYFSRDESCTSKELFNEAEAGNCVYVASPKIGKRRKNSSKQSVRCVLSAYQYNKQANKNEKIALAKQDVEGFTEAFMQSGNQAHIRKAFELAKSTEELTSVEIALIKYFGLHEAFSLKGSLVTKDNTSANRGEIDASLLLNMITSSGNAEFKYDIFPSSNSTVPLKYGSYKVRFKVKLAMTYATTMKKALLGFDLSTTDTQVKEREFEVILTPSNGWETSGEIDFGSIMQGSKGAVFVFKMETELRSIIPSFDLISIEKL